MKFRDYVDIIGFDCAALADWLGEDYNRVRNWKHEKCKCPKHVMDKMRVLYITMCRIFERKGP